MELKRAEKLKGTLGWRTEKILLDELERPLMYLRADTDRETLKIVEKSLPGGLTLQTNFGKLGHGEKDS